VDYLDSTDSHYGSATASVVNSGGKRWLVVNSYPRCGTGCSLDHSAWFELRDGKLRKVLTVPLSGHEIYENPARRFETRFARASRSKDGETLEFVFHVEFRSSVGSSIDVSYLWGDEKVVRFFRSTMQTEFHFDAKNSEASESFVDAIFGPREAGPQLFELIQNHLLDIARGPNGRRREWLKEVLDENPDLPELAPVRAAFSKVLPAAAHPRRDGVGIPDRK